MITKIKNGRLILPDGIFEKNLYIENEKILAITEEELSFDKEIDAEGNYVSAGFIDIHVHGGGGHNFSDATKEAVIEAANIHAKHGTTTIYPTFSSFSYEHMVKALEVIREYKDDDEIIPNIFGVHMEGPYFSPEQVGGQSKSCVRNPDPLEYKNLISDFSGLIKRWSYAPELDGADEFLDYLNQKNIIPSAAHTNAEFEDIKKAYEKGLKLITHLYSCTSTITRKGGFRILGVTETAYLYDDIFVEAIADGCHLPPELLELIYKYKGWEHMCLVTDSIRYGGLENSENVTYKNGDNICIIEDGVAKLADRSAFSGSIATTDKLVKTCVKKAQIPLLSAVKMITEVPARIMKLNTKGKLCEKMDADIVIFDEDINIKRVLVSGKEKFYNA